MSSPLARSVKETRGDQQRGCRRPGYHLREPLFKSVIDETALGDDERLQLFSCFDRLARSAQMAVAVRNVSRDCTTPHETAVTSLAAPSSLRRAAPSTAISSKGFHAHLDVAEVDAGAVAVDRSFTLESTTRLTGTADVIDSDVDCTLEDIAQKAAEVMLARQQVWDAAALRTPPVLLREATFDEDVLELPAAPEGEEVAVDYEATGLLLRRHPLALLRP